MKRLFLLLLLAGCAHRVSVSPPGDEWKGPFYSPERSYAYYVKGQEWIVVSKTGIQKAMKDLCPKDILCSIEVLGQMYHLTRSK